MVFSLIGPVSPKWCERRHRSDRVPSPEFGMVRPGRYKCWGNGTIAFEFEGICIDYGEWIDARRPPEQFHGGGADAPPVAGSADRRGWRSGSCRRLRLYVGKFASPRACAGWGSRHRFDPDPACRRPGLGSDVVRAARRRDSLTTGL